jgi:chromosome segregation ATPase
MDLIQLTKLVQFIDEERRKDRALIAQLQEQVAGLMQEAEARTRYAQSLETVLNEMKLQVLRALGWTSATEQLRQEFAQVIERIEEQRAKAERELMRTRQIEVESLTRQLSELRKEAKLFAGYAEQLEARKAEEGRLAELIGRLQVQVMDLDRRFSQPVTQIMFLEEQRRQDAKRINALEQEIADLKKKIEQLQPKLLLLDEAVRRKQSEVEEAAKLLEAQSQLIETQRVADVRRERQFAEYAEIIEKLKLRAEEVSQQVIGYVQLREEVKRELAALSDFRERLEVRINELFELQREAEERAKRAADAFREQLEKEWRLFAIAQDEKWFERDRRYSELELRTAELEDEVPRFQPQLNLLIAILEAFAKAYAEAGREWLAESNRLIDQLKALLPSEVKPSRRQRKKRQAQAEPPPEPKDGVDLSADLIT